jgi:ABC-type sugar transport system substrate-binding protein
LGGGNPGIFQALQQTQTPGVRVIAHELTAESRLAIERGQLDYVLAQDTRDIARRAFATAMGSKAPSSFCPVMVYMLENLPSDA